MTVAAAVVALVVASGCRSDKIRQDEAVTRAREYLLDNAPELDETEVAFVRYNKPALYSSALVGADTPDESTKLSDQWLQICITWQIPGRKELYMVYGASSGSMTSWRPYRLIRKEFQNTAAERNGRIATARSYVRDNLFGALSAAGFNRVRFHDPEEAVSAMKLDGVPEEQLLLFWALPDEADRYAVVALIPLAGKARYKAVFGGVLSRAELDEEIAAKPSAPATAPATAPAAAPATAPAAALATAPATAPAAAPDSLAPEQGNSLSEGKLESLEKTEKNTK
ncbi:MAG: hypothetical protein PHS41_02075 [Victivallaceae bacterium]|nr:hypothetical protein [Victivallaceae bacterium]